MIIERKLKYIRFEWNDDAQELVIETYGKFSPVEGGLKTGVQERTGVIVLNKSYIFSTMRFITRINQRMSRGFPGWVKRRNQLGLFNKKK